LAFYFCPPLLYTYAVNLNNVFFSYVRVYFIYMCIFGVWNDYSAEFQAACLDLSVATIDCRKAVRNFYLFCTLPPHPLSSSLHWNHVLWLETWAKWDEKPSCKVLNFQHHTFWVIRTRMTSNGLLCGHFAVLPKEKDKKIIPRNRPCPFLRKFGRPLCRPIVIIVGSNVEWIKGSRCCSTHLFCCSSRPNSTMIGILWKSYFFFILIIIIMWTCHHFWYLKKHHFV